MVKFGMGQSVPRTEDPRLLTGRGQYVSDVSFADQAWGYAHRSAYAHAKILSIDTAEAEAAPGVLAVYTYKDVAEAGLGVTKPHFPPRKRPSDGSPEYYTPHPGLASDKAYFVGDPVAFVIAETRDQAKDASELIMVDYDVLPSVTDTALTTEAGSPQLWDNFPNNISNVFNIGNADAVTEAFGKAAHVVEQTYVINRISTNSMESRGCVGVYDPMEERYTLYSDTQTPHGARHALAEVFNVPETQIRIIARDIGGGFGLKDVHFPENRLCLLAAKNLGRPVKWVSERSEAIMSDDHARDQVSQAALALDADGKFLAIRVKTACNMGAYITGGAAMVPTFMNLGCLAGVYTTPAIHVEVTCVLSNTQSTGPYRGAGRPEAMYLLERTIDIAAREIGIDRIELRRRNMIPPEAMPFQTGLTYNYDSGEFGKNMDMALEAADYAGYEARKTDSEAQGKYRGIGIINMLEAAGGPMPEQGEIRFNPGGTVTVLVGTKGQGQGHETMYKILVSDMLGVDAEDIRLLDHDTDAVAHGGGTIGSRSALVGGAVMRGAADKLIEKGKKLAAHIMEAAEGDIEFEDGNFTIAGTDKSVGIKEVAKKSFVPMMLPPGMEVGFYERTTYTPPAASFPNGAHICEVEIDKDTGKVEIATYVAVDDVGTVINALTLEGQVHGGIVQGAGQALMENIAYDPESGQMLSGSFQDYAMPRADDFPSFYIGNNPVPATTNPLGIKGAGEAGTTGALPAVMNAINDALAPLGVRHAEMPLTPEKVWRIMNDAA